MRCGPIRTGSYDHVTSKVWNNLGLGVALNRGATKFVVIICDFARQFDTHPQYEYNRYWGS